MSIVGLKGEKGRGILSRGKKTSAKNEGPIQRARDLAERKISQGAQVRAQERKREGTRPKRGK